jgi:NTP pyrophosphatase (non-canonical NTP hydrolase)
MEIHLPDGIKHYEPELKVFFDAMVYKLKVHASKGKWEDADIYVLASLLDGEVEELCEALENGNSTEALLEAADCANYAMMIAITAVKGIKNPFAARAKVGRSLEYMKWALTHETDKCIPWFFRSRTGPNLEYGSLPKGASPHGRRAHRVMCHWKHGEPPTPEHHAAHTCGFSLCINPKHLRWASATENQGDKKEHGTNVTAVKLDWERVAQIRVQASHKSAAVLAADFGVSKTTIHNILSKKTWVQETDHAK